MTNILKFTLVAMVTSLHPVSNPISAWEPRIAVSSLLGLRSVAYPLIAIAWTAFPFILSIHHKVTLVVSGKRQQLMETVTSLMAEGSLLMGLVAMAWLGLMLVFESPWQLTTYHKAFVVSGTTSTSVAMVTSLHPVSNPSSAWEPQTAVSSLLGLSSVAYPLIAWTTFPFILSIHHKITLVVSAKCQN